MNTEQSFNNNRLLLPCSLIFLSKAVETYKLVTIVCFLCLTVWYVESRLKRMTRARIILDLLATLPEQFIYSKDKINACSSKKVLSINASQSSVTINLLETARTFVFVTIVAKTSWIHYIPISKLQDVEKSSVHIYFLNLNNINGSQWVHDCWSKLEMI